MRQWFVVISSLGILLSGCSHTGAKKEAAAAPANTPAKETPAPKVEAKAPADTGVTRLECSKKNDDRALEVREKDKGCELGYTKSGKETVVATGSHGTTYCTKAMDKIKDKLVAANYDCK